MPSNSLSPSVEWGCSQMKGEAAKILVGGKTLRVFNNIYLGEPSSIASLTTLH